MATIFALVAIIVLTEQVPLNPVQLEPTPEILDSMNWNSACLVHLEDIVLILLLQDNLRMNALLGKIQNGCKGVYVQCLCHMMVWLQTSICTQFQGNISLIILIYSKTFNSDFLEILGRNLFCYEDVSLLIYLFASMKMCHY